MFRTAGLGKAGGFGGTGKFAKRRNNDQEGQGNSNDAAKAVEESLRASFAAQDLGGLGIESGLKSFDLCLLVGDALLLLGNLLVVTRAHRGLPLLLLSFVRRLAVLLELLVAGVSGKPDQAIRLG